MGIFGNLFDPVSPMPWEMGDVPGRKQSLRLEDIYDITPSAESKYPESVWAPPPEIGRGPASDPYPDPYEFKKRELVAACRQAMKMNGMGEKYPRPWTIDDEPTNYMAFPILPGQRIWTGGEPGRFRIVYNKFDGSFYRVVMHRYTTPLSERESTSLGFCWVGEKCGHESSHSHFGSTSPLTKSSHEYPFSPDDIGPHPLRQNPPEVESPLVATKQVNNSKSPTHESDPCFVHATIEPEDTLSNAESRRPSLGNRLVKSPPSTPRRFSNVQSPPQSQRTMLVKSPPVRSRSNAIQSLPLGSDPGPVILSPSGRPISNNIQSPPPGTYTHLPKSTPTVSRHLNIIPSPEIDQENHFVKSPPLPPRRTSVVQSPHDGYDPRLPRSPRLAAKSFSSIHSPVINQDSPFIKSPPMTPMTPQAYSSMHSPTMGYDPSLQRSPRISTRPFNSCQSPILEEETPVKSLKVGIRPSRSFQSPLLGQDPHLTNSPPVIQITRWTDYAQPRRASHA